MRAMVFVLPLLSCAPAREVTPNPVPPAVPLTRAECDGARRLYRERLALPPARLKDPEAPAPISEEAFFEECRARLAGRARRTILRCWQDAPSAAVFLSCNERF